MPIDFETQKRWWEKEGHFDTHRYFELLKIRNPRKYAFFVLFFYGIKVPYNPEKKPL